MGAPINILLVDDEINILNALRRVLQPYRYTIHVAENPIEGLACLENCPIDLVISDYRMPQMNGLDFLSQIKESSPQTIKILLSGYSDAQINQEVMDQAGILKCFWKPWNNSELIACIQNALSHGVE